MVLNACYIPQGRREALEWRRQVVALGQLPEALSVTRRADLEPASVQVDVTRHGHDLRRHRQIVRRGLVEYVPFPEALVGKYQCHTQADLSRLRAVGCLHEFSDVAAGVERYVRWLNADEAAA